MLNIVKLDPQVLQFEGFKICRPAAVPFNKVDCGVIKYAGYTDGSCVMMIVPQDEKKKAVEDIWWVYGASNTVMKKVSEGDKDMIGYFMDMLTNGIYKLYIEHNMSYFL